MLQVTLQALGGAHDCVNHHEDTVTYPSGHVGLVPEVHVTWSVHHVYQVTFPTRIGEHIRQRRCFQGDTALTLVQTSVSVPLQDCSWLGLLEVVPGRVGRTIAHKIHLFLRHPDLLVLVLLRPGIADMLYENIDERCLP